MRRTFDVNTIAPCMITKAFRPLLKRAAEVKQPGEQPEAAVVNISSSLGSIDNITNAYMLAYKVSKAA
jgi:NAD(P)-dependent dehydrogenase (short-subunit alcohol dehydrogenase family)